MLSCKHVIRNAYRFVLAVLRVCLCSSTMRRARGSHSVIELRTEYGGRLTMVDCAGTERKEDSMYHSSER